MNSPSSLELAGTGGSESRSAPPLDAPPPPRGGARGGRGRGRRRAGPGHTPQARAGSAARGAAPEFPEPGRSRRCALHLGFWRPPPASERSPHAGEAAPARSPAAARERLVLASACHRRPPSAEGVSSKLQVSSGCLDCFPYFCLTRCLWPVEISALTSSRASLTPTCARAG